MSGVREARALSWPKVQALARGGAVALVPCGSTEAHGPHLPLSVDVVISETVCRRVAMAMDCNACKLSLVSRLQLPKFSSKTVT